MSEELQVPVTSNVALARLRHARAKLKESGIPWDTILGQVERCSGLLLNNGLVHALLAMRKGCRPISSGGKEGAQTAVAAALVDWLGNRASPAFETFKSIKESTAGEVQKVALDNNQHINAIQQAVLALMETDDTFGFMAVQDEAHRYLAAAKVVAGAFAKESAQ